MPVQPLVRIGTRASRLAQAQSRMMQARIVAALGAPPDAADEVAPLVLITTTGDRIQDRRLLEAGGKALFVKEIEEALLAGRIDCAIHSMKDVPAELPDGLVIAAVPEREDARDAFLSLRHADIGALPAGATVGTASLRRQAQTLHRRPDLKVEMLRGNVDTRLRKLDEGDFDAILLAAAGLNRLGLSERITSCIEIDQATPAPGQGALAIETRADDRGSSWLAGLHHAPTEIAVAAERGALDALEGSCRTAIGAHARLSGGRLDLVVEALTPDGVRRFLRSGSIDNADARSATALGCSLGLEVKAEGGPGLVFG